MRRPRRVPGPGRQRRNAPRRASSSALPLELGNRSPPAPTAPATPAPAPAAPPRISGGRSRAQDGSRYSDHAERISSDVTYRPDDDQRHDRKAANHAMGGRTQERAN